MLIIMEFTLSEPREMTRNGEHHLFELAHAPTPGTVDAFLTRLVAEARTWGQTIRRAPAAITLDELLHFTPGGGRARLHLSGYGPFYVQWVVVDGAVIDYFEGNWPLTPQPATP